jgi:hypothetical protein
MADAVEVQVVTTDYVLVEVHGRSFLVGCPTHVHELAGIHLR